MDAMMNMPEVIVIPPNKPFGTKKIRVAAYARVSTDSEDQKNSFITQMDYYTKYIADNPEMEFVDLYADEAVTGTKVDKRDEFNRMMQDCREGKIDLILTKSASRFARNTFDGLSAVRKLKSMGIDVVFEENEIDTRTMIGETELTFVYSLAQEEAVSDAKNVRMGVRFRMKNGTFKQGQILYGFDIKDGVFTIVEEEAEIVRLMFIAYREGKSTWKIAEELNEMGVPKKRNTTKWVSNNIKYILTNVRYKGDALLQKTYTTDLPFKRVQNKGELDMYYVKDANPAIVSEELFDTVNKLMKEQRERYGKGGGKVKREMALRGMIYCAECGNVYRLKENAENTFWVCRNHSRKAELCRSKPIKEQVIYDAFVQIYNRLVMNKEYILDRMLNQLKTLKEVKYQQNREFHHITAEIAELTEQILEIERLNCRGFLESALYLEKKNEYNSRIIELKKERKRAAGKDESDVAIKETEKICNCIEKNGSISEFNENIFKKIVNKILADSNKLIFELKNGMKVKYEME